MSPLRIFILWLQWKAFGRPSVVLFDFDGEINARLAHGFRSYRYAKRYGLGVKNVGLAPGGRLINGSFVTRWEPLFPPSQPALSPEGGK